jgi:tetratricopeptide (TPR) repeat protein
MHSIELLELKWHNYQLKKRLPWYSYLLLTLLAYVYLEHREAIGSHAKMFFLDMNSSVLVVAEPQLTHTIVKKDGTQSLKDENSSSISKADKGAMAIEFNDEPPVKEHERKFINIIVTDKADVNGTSSSSRDELKIVEERFGKNQTYEDALYLASNYYSQGNYDKSVKWSLICNNLNSNSEESWIIFAKSKAKLGKARDAVKILEAYLKENNSEKGQLLLEKLNSGSRID